MLRKSLLAIFTFTPLFVCAEAYNFNPYDNKEATPLLRNLMQYPSNIYVEGFGSLQLDRVISNWLNADDEKEVTKKHSTRKSDQRDIRSKEQRRHHHIQDSQSVVSAGRRSSEPPKPRARSSSRSRLGVSELLSFGKKKPDSRRSKSQSRKSDVTKQREYTTSAPQPYVGEENLISNHEAQHATPERPSKPISSLSELMRKNHWLAGVTVGYRLDRNTAIEVTLPMGSFSPFYMLPSVSGKYTLSQGVGKIRFYGKLGLGIPFTWLKHAETTEEDTASLSSEDDPHQQELRHNRMAPFLKEKEKLIKQAEGGSVTEKEPLKESSSLKFRYDLVPMGTLGAFFPIYPNIVLEGSLNLMYSCTKTKMQSSFLPNGFIGTAQVGVRFRLG